MLKRLCPAILVLVGTLGAAATASAATMSYDGTTVRVTAAPGERNDIGVRINAYEGDANAYYGEDGGSTLTAGSGCEVNPNGSRGGIRCQASGPSPVVIDAGDGDDKVSSPLAGTILGGPGNDVLRGGTSGPQTFDGGAGNDSFEGDATGYCTSGNGARGQDTYVGGEGADIVRYDDEDVGFITVTIDGVANDGASGENDNVDLDVEGVYGTDCAANNLTGSNGPNTLLGQGVLNGLGGDDVLTGSGSDDKLLGGDGNDKLTGRSGNDELDGGAGDDFLEGGFDDDRLTGGAGKDSLVGDETASNTIGTGNDIINAADGIGENVSCGPGSDVANIDGLDTVPVDTQNLCEVVNKAAGGGGAPTAGSFPLTLPASLKASRSGRVTVKLVCKVTDAVGCNGTLRLASVKKVRIGGKSRTFSMGTKSFSIAPGKTLRVTFKLTAGNRKALRSLKRVKLRATAKERAATPRVATKILTLR